VEDFDDLVRRYRRELHVHCYRMLGSFDEAEDHVQEVFLRAWRSRDCFEGRSSPRTWLYRVATNACLDTLRRDARRAVPRPAGRGPSVAAMPWAQPYPDSLLDELAAGQSGPESVAVSRETISLAFLAAIQLLPFVLAVLRFEDGRLADIAAFEQPSMFTAFGLPASL
jgi:RNA polymerase sigma-70 factor (ECF subfamily)